MSVSKEKQKEQDDKLNDMVAERGILLTVDDAWGWVKGHACATPWCSEIIKQWNKPKLVKWYFDHFKDIPGVSKYKWGHLWVCHVCTSMIWHNKQRDAMNKQRISEGRLH